MDNFFDETTGQSMHPHDIAERLTKLTNEERLVNFYSLPNETKAAIFSYFDPAIQHEIIQALGDKETAEFLNKMDPDDRTKFFIDLPDEFIKDAINLLNDKQREVALNLLGYPEDSIARLMTPNYIRVKPHWTVEHVLEHIKRYSKIAETLNFIYVVDQNFVLLDDIVVGKLLMVDKKTLVSDLCDYKFVALKTTMPQEVGAEEFKKYDRSALPVVTNTGVLVGIVTADDMFDVLTQETTEDIQKFGGLEALDTPYNTTPFFQLYKKRSSWLIILFIGELFTATAMTYYEHQLEQAIVLALFIPLIISSGGNTGSQASTLIIRAMALREIALKDWFKVLGKEISMGLLLGLTLALFGFLRVETWQQLGWYNYGEHSVLLGLTIAGALTGVVLWGTVAGAMIPFVLKSIGLDPATSSAPLVATLVDVTGLIIYFGVAILILSGTLL